MSAAGSQNTQMDPLIVFFLFFFFLAHPCGDAHAMNERAREILCAVVDFN